MAKRPAEIFGVRRQAERDTAFWQPIPESAVAASLCRRTPKRQPHKKNPVALRPRDLTWNFLFALEANADIAVKDGSQRAVAGGGKRIAFRLAVRPGRILVGDVERAKGDP